MRRSDSGWKNDRPFVERSTIVRVRYAETDAMGWVYYANYLTYFEVGRTELIRDVWRPYRQMESDGMRLPVIEAGCRYIRGARYDDELRVETRMSCPTSYRVHFEYRILDPTDGQVLATGFTQHCFVNTDGKLIKVPVELKSMVSS